MQRFVGNPEAVNAEADAFGTLISGMAKDVAWGGDEARQNLVAAATSRHITQLESLLGTVPEQARPAIQRALSNSVRGHDAALAALRGDPLPAGFERPGFGRNMGSSISGMGAGMGGPPSGIGGRPAGIGGGFGGFGGGPPAGIGRR